MFAPFERPWPLTSTRAAQAPSAPSRAAGRSSMPRGGESIEEVYPPFPTDCAGDAGRPRVDARAHPASFDGLEPRTPGRDPNRVRGLGGRASLYLECDPYGITCAKTTAARIPTTDVPPSATPVGTR